MGPMTDAEAVLFIMTVALLVALAQVAGWWPLLTPYRWFTRNGDDGLEQHKGPGRGDAPGPLAPPVGRLVRSAQLG